jgi:hypothetical protein
MSTTTEQRPQLAKHSPSPFEGHSYNTYWFADVRNGRAHACSCPDYFHRNIVAGDPDHLCHHLRELAPKALETIHREVTRAKEGNVDELANALGIPRKPHHPYSAVYVDGKLDYRLTARAGARNNLRVVA